MNFIRFTLPIAVRKAFSGIKLQCAGLVQVVKDTMQIVSASGSREVAVAVYGNVVASSLLVGRRAAARRAQDETDIVK